MYQKYLIIGATRGTGLLLVEQLLAQGKEVGVIARSLSKMKNALKDKYEKLSKVLEYEFGNSEEEDYVLYLNQNKPLVDMVEWCDIIISTTGTTPGGDAFRSDYMAPSELIKLCQNIPSFNKNDKLFVYVTSLYITRPKTFIAFLLNYMVNNVLGWKALSENKLRQSGLRYLIVRPGRLTDELNKSHPVRVLQGDRQSGTITRENTAKAIINLILQNKFIESGKMTVDIFEDRSRTSQNFELSPQETISPDDESSIITSDHFNTTKNIILIIYFILTLLFIWIICKFK
jgi:hypothetical protein